MKIMRITVVKPDDPRLRNDGVHRNVAAFGTDLFQTLCVKGDKYFSCLFAFREKTVIVSCTHPEAVPMLIKGGAGAENQIDVLRREYGVPVRNQNPEAIP